MSTKETARQSQLSSLASALHLPVLSFFLPSEKAEKEQVVGSLLHAPEPTECKGWVRCHVTELGLLRWQGGTEHLREREKEEEVAFLQGKLGCFNKERP